MGEAIQGANTIIKICKEAAFGTIPAAPVWHKVAVKLTGGFKPNVNQIKNDLSGGDRNPRQALLGNKKSSGSLTLYASWDFLPYVLEMIGLNRASTGAGPTWTQTCKLDGTLCSYVIQEILDMATDEAIVSTGCRVNTAKIAVASEGYMQVDLTFVARLTDYVDASSIAAGSTIDNSDDILISHDQVTAAEVTLSAGAVAYIKSGSIDVNNNLKSDDYRVGGAGALFTVGVGRADVTATFNVAWTEEASTKVKAVLAAPDTAIPVSLNWDGGTPEVTLALPNAFMVPDLPPLKDGDLEATLIFNAAYDTGAATAIEGIVINEIDPATGY